MPSILFGSVSTIADTSELQRAAFNDAFAQHGLDWQWDRETYRAQLASNGGQQRIADHAAERGEDVDAAAVHRTKSELFRAKLAEGPVTTRPGVAAAIKEAVAQGHHVGLVTTTSPENVQALLDAVAGEIDRSDLDVVVDATAVDQPKPDPACYRWALERLATSADQAVAVEDNPGGVTAAREAGIACVAFPNANTADLEFDGAVARVDEVDLDRLTAALAR